MGRFAAFAEDAKSIGAARKPSDPSQAIWGSGHVTYRRNLMGSKGRVAEWPAKDGDQMRRNPPREGQHIKVPPTPNTHFFRVFF